MKRTGELRIGSFWTPALRRPIHRKHERAAGQQRNCTHAQHEPAIPILALDSGRLFGDRSCFGLWQSRTLRLGRIALFRIRFCRIRR